MANLYILIQVSRSWSATNKHSANDSPSEGSNLWRKKCCWRHAVICMEQRLPNLLRSSLVMKRRLLQRTWKLSTIIVLFQKTIWDCCSRTRCSLYLEKLRLQSRRSSYNQHTKSCVETKTVWCRKLWQTSPLIDPWSGPSLCGYNWCDA